MNKLTTSFGLALALEFLSATALAVELPQNVTVTGGDGLGTHLEFDFGNSHHKIAAPDLNLLVLDAFDCDTFNTKDLEMAGEFFYKNAVSVDQTTGNIAIGVHLRYCVLISQSAVFIINPQQDGAVAYYRLQVPGERPFPHEFSSYPLDSVSQVSYSANGDLTVVDGDASGATTTRYFTVDPAKGGSSYYPKLERQETLPGE